MSDIPPTPPPTDSDALQQWQQVFAECEPGLRAFLRGRLGQHADVEDCLQAIHLKLAESCPKVAPAARRAWLFRVAANEAARRWRDKATTDRVLQRQSRDIAPPDQDDLTDQAILTETTEQIRRALQNLPDSWQQVVRLRIYENLTFQQIADRLQIPLGTALTQMRRALERLRSEMESDDQT